MINYISVEQILFHLKLDIKEEKKRERTSSNKNMGSVCSMWWFIFEEYLQGDGGCMGPYYQAPGEWRSEGNNAF